jgi:hypothetical protein
MISSSLLRTQLAQSFLSQISWWGSACLVHAFANTVAYQVGQASWPVQRAKRACQAWTGQEACPTQLEIRGRTSETTDLAETAMLAVDITVEELGQLQRRAIEVVQEWRPISQLN